MPQVGKGQPSQASKENVRSEPEEPDDQDAREDVIHFDEALGSHHYRADSVGSSNDLGDHEVGPAHRQHLADRIPSGVISIASNLNLHDLHNARLR